MSSTDALRPRSISEIVDASIQLLRTQYRGFLVLSVVALTPDLVVSIYNTAVLVPRYAGRASLIALPILLLTWLWLAVGDAAIVAAVADTYLGARVDPRAALGRALPRAWAVIWSAFLKYAIIGLGFGVVLVAALLVVGIFGAVAAGILAATGAGVSGLNTTTVGLIVGTLAALFMTGAVAWWTLYAVARFFAYRATIMIEYVGAVESLRRSSALAKGEGKRVILTFLLLYVVYGAVFALLYAIAYVASGRLVVAQMAAGVVALFIYPIIPIVTTLLYYDVRMRKEGYDLELMAAELEGTSPAPSA
jgi:hypothetical protein